MERSWPTPPSEVNNSLYLWDLEIVKLLRTGDIFSTGVDVGSGTVIATGGVTPISLANRFGAQLHAADFGVKADGTTDDTAAMQAAINAALANKSPLFLPIGNIKTSSTLTVAAALCMIGWGHTLSVFKPTSTTLNVIDITCVDPVEFKDFGIDATAITMTNGIGINVTHASSRNLESQFTGIRVIGLFYGFVFDRAAYWTMHRCFVEDCIATGITVRNVFSADEGDSNISNCLIQFAGTPVSTNILLFQASSGGLKIHGCKFNGGYHGYHLGLAAGANTLGPIITGNTFEGQTVASLFFGADNDATSTIRRTVITGNEIAPFANGHGIQIGGTANQWFKGATISGNTITVDLNAAAASSAKGIVANWATKLAISGNVLSNDGAVGTTIGIELGSNVSLVSKALNVINGFATALSDASTSPQTETFKGGVLSSSPSAGMGYTAGAGGAVTQVTSKATAVTLNTMSGQITMNNANLAAGTVVTFQVNNTAIQADDQIHVSHMSGGANAGHYLVGGRGISAGASFVIDVKNTTAGVLGEALVLKFTIIRGANS